MSRISQFSSNLGCHAIPTLSKDMFMSHEQSQYKDLKTKNQTQSEFDKKLSGKSLRDLETIISSKQKPLMGLSYIFGLSAEKFCCVLCNKWFHMNLIVGHIIGNSHRRKYCQEHFPTLSTELEQLHNAHLDEILYELLEVVAAKVDEVSPQKLPITYVRRFFIKNEQYVYDQIKNSPHVCVNTRSGFEIKLMNSIMKKTEEIISSKIDDEIVTSNVEKFTVANINQPAQTVQISAFNAAKAFPEEINFHKLMDGLENLKLDCKLDANQIKILSESALVLEQKFKNTSNILFMLHKDFLLETRQKIHESDLDTESVRNLANYVVLKIDEMVTKMNMESIRATKQASCPEPPSGDIFKATEESKLMKFSKNYQRTPENYQQPPLTQQQLPVIVLANLRVDHNLPSQIIPVVSSEPLPSRFLTTAHNPMTNCYHWYDGFVLDENNILH